MDFIYFSINDELTNHLDIVSYIYHIDQSFLYSFKNIKEFSYLLPSFDLGLDKPKSKDLTKSREGNKFLIKAKYNLDFIKEKNPLSDVIFYFFNIKEYMDSIKINSVEEYLKIFKNIRTGNNFKLDVYFLETLKSKKPNFDEISAYNTLNPLFKTDSLKGILKSIEYLDKTKLTFEDRYKKYHNFLYKNDKNTYKYIDNIEIETEILEKQLKIINVPVLTDFLSVQDGIFKLYNDLKLSEDIPMAILCNSKIDYDNRKNFYPSIDNLSYFFLRPIIFKEEIENNSNSKLSKYEKIFNDKHFNIKFESSFNILEHPTYNEIIMLNLNTLFMRFKMENGTYINVYLNLLKGENNYLFKFKINLSLTESMKVYNKLKTIFSNLVFNDENIVIDENYIKSRISFKRSYDLNMNENRFVAFSILKNKNLIELDEKEKMFSQRKNPSKLTIKQSKNFFTESKLESNKNQSNSSYSYSSSKNSKNDKSSFIITGDEKFFNDGNDNNELEEETYEVIDVLNYFKLNIEHNKVLDSSWSLYCYAYDKEEYEKFKLTLRTVLGFYFKEYEQFFETNIKWFPNFLFSEKIDISSTDLNEAQIKQNFYPTEIKKIKVIQKYAKKEISNNFSDYSNKCQCPKQPILISDEEIEDWNLDHVKKINNKYFACLDDKYPIFKKDHLCCFDKPEKEDGAKIINDNIITIKKRTIVNYTPKNTYSVISEDLKEFISSFKKDYILLRKGTEESSLENVIKNLKYKESDINIFIFQTAENEFCIDKDFSPFYPYYRHCNHDVDNNDKKIIIQPPPNLEHKTIILFKMFDFYEYLTFNTSTEIEHNKQMIIFDDKKLTNALYKVFYKFREPVVYLPSENKLIENFCFNFSFENSIKPLLEDDIQKLSKNHFKIILNEKTGLMKELMIKELYFFKFETECLPFFEFEEIKLDIFETFDTVKLKSDIWIKPGNVKISFYKIKKNKIRNITKLQSSNFISQTLVINRLSYLKSKSKPKSDDFGLDFESWFKSTVRQNQKLFEENYFYTITKKPFLSLSYNDKYVYIPDNFTSNDIEILKSFYRNLDEKIIQSIDKIKANSDIVFPLLGFFIDSYNLEDYMKFKLNINKKEGIYQNVSFNPNAIFYQNNYLLDKNYKYVIYEFKNDIKIIVDENDNNIDYKDSNIYIINQDLELILESKGSNLNNFISLGNDVYVYFKLI